MSKTKLSIFLPTYNEEKIISKSLDTLFDYVEKNIDLDKYEVNITVVNDGSKDNTYDEVMKNHHTSVNMVSYQPNHGKGYAVREGIRYSLDKLDADYIIFMDADLSTDLKAINDCLSLLEQGKPCVIGSRYDKGSNILVKQTLIRRIISKLGRMIISSMFRFKLNETQCGFKGFNKELAQLLLKLSRIDDFCFDVEYLYIAKLNHYEYVSFPVTWSDYRDSRVSPLKSSIKFYRDLFKLKRNAKYYK